MEYREEGPEVIVMSAFGQSADWLRNIRAFPTVEMTIGRQQFSMVHRCLDPDEAAAVVWRYEQRNWLFKPVIHVVLSRFLGWQYRGTDRDRCHLVAQLPMIAFRPKGAAYPRVSR
jgi:deazaflavin-dependent oxidoreductase (nitroreductase family)